MTPREEAILKRGSNLPEPLRNKFDALLLDYVDHEYEHEEILNKLEAFLNNIGKEEL